MLEKIKTVEDAAAYVKRLRIDFHRRRGSNKKVMVDTNVFLSAYLFPEKGYRKMLQHIAENDELLLPDLTIRELKQIADGAAMTQLDGLRYQTVIRPADAFYINYVEGNDQAALQAALAVDANFFLTDDITMQVPKLSGLLVLTPMEYCRMRRIEI